MSGKGSGDASAIGSGLKLPPAWAAFANAAQGHITETDDGHRTSIMHIGTVVIPVVLALAESRKLTGARIMEALVCGYDVAIRSGECFGRNIIAFSIPQPPPAPVGPRPPPRKQ
jgi:2-methylcitrate dehydratase PrpD